jgi:hypothetical protein
MVRRLLRSRLLICRFAGHRERLRLQGRIEFEGSKASGTGKNVKEYTRKDGTKVTRRTIGRRLTRAERRPELPAQNRGSRLPRRPRRYAGFERPYPCGAPRRRTSSCGRLATRTVALTLRFKVLSWCRSARFSRTSSRWPRQANASARMSSRIVSSTMKILRLHGRPINRDGVQL